MTNRLTILSILAACSLWCSSTPATAQVLTTPVTSPGSALVSEGAGSIRDLFEDTIEDFTRLPSTDSLTVLSIGGAVAALAHAADGDVTRTLTGSTQMGETLSAGQTIGGARAQIAGALATYAFGRVTGDAAVTSIGADLIGAQILTQTMTGTVKFAVGRTRPDGTNYSFPSGHAASAFATATVLQRRLGWAVGVPAYAVAGYVAASRIQVKRHFLSDVSFGAAIGIIAGRAVTIGSGTARFAVTPVATRGGAGVNLNWVGR